MPALGLTWGVSEEERALPFPCDELLTGNGPPAHRGVTVEACPARVFRRLCQLRVAPYSYDWIDNFGKRSPEALTPGLEHLEVGQEVMRIFRLESFEPERHLTLRIAREGALGLFGELAVSYLIAPSEDPGRCRLLAKLVFVYPPGLKGLLLRLFLPFGDLVMMRKQLLNLKRLAEADARRVGPEP
jgi:hypothetical protein